MNSGAVILFALIEHHLIFGQLISIKSTFRQNGARQIEEPKNEDYTNEPDYVKPVYHYPNAYESESYKFWKRAEGQPHYHGDQPALGRLHQHYPPYRDAENYENYITDPPGVGLNYNEENAGKINKTNGNKVGLHTTTSGKYGGNVDRNDENYDSSGSQHIGPNSGSHIGPGKKNQNSLHSQHKKAKGTKSKIIDFDIEHLKLLDNNSEDGNDRTSHPGSSGNRGLIDIDPNDPTRVNSLVSNRHCCSCCSRDGDIVKDNTAPIGPNGPAPFQPQPNSPAYAPPFQPQPSGNCGGCGGSVGACGSCGSSCCTSFPSPCCIPQLPCCPRIQIPCCPVQPICCQPNTACGVCRSSAHRALRTKRFGCIPCIGRRKRDVNLSSENETGEINEHLHIRRKRLGCVPCLRRRAKRNESAMSSTFEKFLKRISKREAAIPVQPSIAKRHVETDQCDSSCCDYSKCSRAAGIPISSIIQASSNGANSDIDGPLKQTNATKS